MRFDDTIFNCLQIIEFGLIVVIVFESPKRVSRANWSIEVEVANFGLVEGEK